MPAFKDVEGERLEKTEDEWRQVLTSAQFRVMRKQGTERAFSDALQANKAEGLYSCAGCGLQLFDSAAKFDSGTGWPSFYEPVAEKAIATLIDKKLFQTRTEVHCARCGSHLGHLFEDGPPPTGLRYCLNAVSLEFEAS